MLPRSLHINVHRLYSFVFLACCNSIVGDADYKECKENSNNKANNEFGVGLHDELRMHSLFHTDSIGVHKWQAFIEAGLSTDKFSSRAVQGGSIFI